MRLPFILLSCCFCFRELLLVAALAHTAIDGQKERHRCTCEKRFIHLYFTSVALCSHKIQRTHG